jgi:hypothetical protein
MALTGHTMGKILESVAECEHERNVHAGLDITEQDAIDYLIKKHNCPTYRASIQHRNATDGGDWYQVEHDG